MATVTSDQTASFRRYGTRFQHGPSFLAALVLRPVCAGLLISVAVIHLHLWTEGYRDIPTVGPLFFADVVGGFLLAAVLLVWPRPLPGLLGAGFMISTLGGLIVSLNFGLFGLSGVDTGFVRDRDHYFGVCRSARLAGLDRRRLAGFDPKPVQSSLSRPRVGLSRSTCPNALLERPVHR
jgi:hypothetical protein